MTFRISTLAAASLCLAFAAPVAMAQSTAAKPAPKPAGKTLGGKAAGGGKLMTRDELRGCLKRLDEVNQAAKGIDSARPALDSERDALKASGEALRAERTELDRKLVAVREWEGRVRAHAVEIEAFNQRSAAVERAPRNQQEKLFEELKGDRERLLKTHEMMAADKAVLVPAYRESEKSYNEHAVVHDAKVSAWNQRKSAIDAQSVAQQEAHALWRNECFNRPYLEDDEMAVKAGK